MVKEFNLICELDIEFLSPGLLGQIISDGGDIDNQIKVLLDVLRVPTDGGEMQLGQGGDLHAIGNEHHNFNKI